MRPADTPVEKILHFRSLHKRKTNRKGLSQPFRSVPDDRSEYLRNVLSRNCCIAQNNRRHTRLSD